MRIKTQDIQRLWESGKQYHRSVEVDDSDDQLLFVYNMSAGSTVSEGEELTLYGQYLGALTY